MKKIYILLVSLACLFLLVSCAPPDDIQDIIDNDREEYFESGATQITMWCADFEEWQNQLNVKQRMDFNDIKDDGIQLNQVFIEQTDIDDRLRSARESNSTPDIYMISIGNLYKEVKNGYALDVTSYFSTWNDLTEIGKETVCYNGKYYGYPIVMEPSTLVYYRKDLLAEYGNGATEIPNTWSEFLGLCKTVRSNIKSKGTKGLYTFDVPKGVACAWGTWGMQISAAGCLAVNDNWDTPLVLTEGKEGYLKLGDLWAQLYGNGYVPLTSGGYSEYITDLCLGKQVMTTCGSWSISEIINSYPEMKDQIGVAPMPTFDGSHDGTTATNGGWVYVISNSCKNPEKAAEVIKFLVAGDDTAETEEYFKLAYYSKISPRKSVQEKIEASLSTQTEVPAEWISVITDVANKAILEPIYSWDISVAIELYLENCAMGDDIQTSLNTAYSDIQKVINSEQTAGTNPRLKK